MSGEKEGIRASAVEMLQIKGREQNTQYGDPLCSDGALLLTEWTSTLFALILIINGLV